MVVLISSVVMIVAIVIAIIIVAVIAIAITIATIIIIVVIARAIIIPFWIVPTILPKMGSLMSNTWVIRPGSALAIVLIVILIVILIIVSIVVGLLRFFLIINIKNWDIVSKLGHSINGFSGKFLANFLESLPPWLWHCIKE